MTLQAFLLTAAALIGIGVYGALSQQSIVMLMMGLELILNGVLLAVASVWHFVAPFSAKGQVFAIIALTLMAVEAALGFAILIAVYRGRQLDTVDGAKDLRG
jgi:NAD(P)H-quinone oxidoreductase subunit 4L